MEKFQEHDTKTAETFKHPPPPHSRPELFCACAFLCALGILRQACPVTLWWRQREGNCHLSRVGPCREGREPNGPQASLSSTDPCPFCGNAVGWRKRKRSEKMQVRGLTTALEDPGEKG